MKLNLACGKKIKEGFINVDIAAPADMIVDLNKYPYPFEDNSVDYILAEHIIEHLQSPNKFLEEIHRILKDDGVARIETPHYKNQSSYCDFSHLWHFHEDCINIYTERIRNNNTKPLFICTMKHVTRGKYKPWKKHDITWEIKKETQSD